MAAAGSGPRTDARLRAVDPALPAVLAGRRRPPRRVVVAMSVPLVAAAVLSYVGDGFMPGLVEGHPLVLLALNPRNRNLVLVANQLDAWSYYGVGFVRLVATDPLWFLLGYWYGDAAVTWAERRTRTVGEVLRWVESSFGKAAYPLVALAPNNWICLFAGSAGMSLGAFAILNVAGTFGRLYLARVLGDRFADPIDDLLGFIADNRMPLLVLSLGLMAVSVGLELRRGGGDLEGVSDLVDEVDPTGPGDPTATGDSADVGGAADG